MKSVDPTPSDLNDVAVPHEGQPSQNTAYTNSDPDVVQRHQEILDKVMPENVKTQLGRDGMNQIAKKNASTAPPIGAQNQIDYSKMTQIDGLPSDGRFYDKPLYGRSLSVNELKKLASIGENSVTAIDDIIRAATAGPAHEEILIGDKLYIILWLRANTYPKTQYQVKFICSRCNKESSFHFNVNNIETKILPEEDITGPLELSNGDQVCFRYLTIADEQRIKNFQNSVKHSRSVFDEDTLILAASIVSINGKKLPMMSLHKYLSSSPEIYAEVDSYLSDFDFGIDPVLQVTCSQCGGVSPMGLSFRRDFIIPAYRPDNYLRDAVQN